MEHVLALWPVYAPAAFFAALAVGMIRLEEFRKARIFFWMAAVLLAAVDLVWQFTTPAPSWFRRLNGLLAAVLIFVIFPKVLRWLNRREASARLAR
jgi:hypothetical protein